MWVSEEEKTELEEQRLRVLILEDSPADVELCLRQLEKDGLHIDPTVVANLANFEQSVAERSYDLVLSDFRLPQGNGLDALKFLRASKRNIPFILVTGSLGEELAVKCLREGAADYVLKDGLMRLPVAVRRVLKEMRFREEQNRLEEQFRQIQKIEAIGRLAGGIAHDFNNLINVIVGYSDLVLEKLPAGNRLERNIQEIRKAGRRAARLTRQLLAFSRQQALRPQVLNLNNVVTDIAKMLTRLVGEDIELTTRLDSSLGCSMADVGQLEQVIMNLVINARDAMTTGGTIGIETANVELDQTYAKSHAGATPGRYVMMAVSDTGCGMDRATQAQVFEPFFTTKESGKGTGLGLSTVYGIVKQSNGLIYVYSEPGKGTTFRIYLPRVLKGTTAEEGAAETARSVAGSETILLVEDESALRDLTGSYLSGCGYRVLEAKDGEMALQLARQHRDSIHLLLTDVVLPKVGGRVVWERLHPLKPGMKVLFMSGYTDDTILRNGLLKESMPLIQKPYSLLHLGDTIRKVLDAKPSGQVE
jgi:two-component system cell cycle sensor histidine kinase/response regulator CckA